MADFNFERPHWEKLSEAVKEVIKSAYRTAVLAKQGNVTSLNIMSVLVNDYPSTTKRFTSLTADEIKFRLSDLLLSNTTGEELTISYASYKK